MVPTLDGPKWMVYSRKESGAARRNPLTRPPAAQKNHLWFSPVVFPFYRTYHVLTQSSAACKALKVLKTTVLKRLYPAFL